MICSKSEYRVDASHEKHPRCHGLAPGDPVPGTACSLHGTVLRRGRAELLGQGSGLPAGYIAARRTLFPHADSWDWSPDCITLGVDDVQEAIYCEKCREAELAWLQEHPERDRSPITLK